LIGRYGHDVKLMPPAYVKPYVKRNKNDGRDAEAICEAVSRPTMRFVAVKSVEQQDIQALHRMRQLLVHQRTAVINHLRGILGERGVVVAKSPARSTAPCRRCSLPRATSSRQHAGACSSSRCNISTKPTLE
jgi:transposase